MLAGQVDTVADVTVVVILEVIVDKGDTPPVIRVQHKATQKTKIGPKTE